MIKKINCHNSKMWGLKFKMPHQIIDLFTFHQYNIIGKTTGFTINQTIATVLSILHLNAKSQ